MAKIKSNFQENKDSIDLFDELNKSITKDHSFSPENNFKNETELENLYFILDRELTPHEKEIFQFAFNLPKKINLNISINNSVSNLEISKKFTLTTNYVKSVKTRIIKKIITAIKKGI